MTGGPHRISRTIAQKRDALLGRYDAEDLHQFRVQIRRARSMLKRHPEKRSTQIRREWGDIAARTNAARDWDTLALYAEAILPGRQWRDVRPCIEQHRDAAREQVLEALRSGAWDTTWQHWCEWQKRTDDGNREQDSPTLDAGDMLLLVQDSASIALSARDERSWHKLRIAVKNLRYSLDTARAKSTWKKKDRNTLKKLCRHLQEELGNWHDTVVHRELVQSLLKDIPNGSSADVHTALRTLAADIESRRLEHLERALALVQEKGLAAGAGTIKLRRRKTG